MVQHKQIQLNKEISIRKLQQYLTLLYASLSNTLAQWCRDIRFRTVQLELGGLWESIWLPCCSVYHDIEPYWRSYQLSVHKNNNMLEWEHTWHAKHHYSTICAQFRERTMIPAMPIPTYPMMMSFSLKKSSMAVLQSWGGKIMIEGFLSFFLD